MRAGELKRKVLPLASACFVLSLSLSVVTAPPAGALLGELRQSIEKPLKWLIGADDAEATTPPPANSSSSSAQTASPTEKPSSSSTSEASSTPQSVGAVEQTPPPASEIPPLKGTVLGAVATAGTVDLAVSRQTGVAPVTTKDVEVPFEIIYPSEQGWIILGVAWYWWLVGAGIVGLVAQSARHRPQPGLVAQQASE